MEDRLAEATARRPGRADVARVLLEELVHPHRGDHPVQVLDGEGLAHGGRQSLLMAPHRAFRLRMGRAPEGVDQHAARQRSARREIEPSPLSLAQERNLGRCLGRFGIRRGLRVTREGVIDMGRKVKRFPLADETRQRRDPHDLVESIQENGEIHAAQVIEIREESE